MITTLSGSVISSPEYVHSIPGGLKNALDWLVSRSEIMDKPVALVHASHRGEEVLTSLRRILSTITIRFASQIFLRIPLLSLTPVDAAQVLQSEAVRQQMSDYLRSFTQFISDQKE